MKTVLTILCVLSIGLFFTYESSKITKVTHGFASYYTFSRLLLEENDFSCAYDTAYFNAKIKEYGIEGVRDLPNNLPTSAFLFLPVAKLKPGIAKTVWTAANFIFYLLTVALLLNIFAMSIKDYTGLLLVSISFLFLPVYYGISLGQAYVFLLLLFTISIYGLKKESNLITSFPLALILILKGYGIISLIALAGLKKWREFFTTLAFSVILIVITLPVVGTGSWKEYISTGFLKVIKNDYASSVAYQTINSLILNIFPYFAEIIIVVLGLFSLVIFLRIIPQDKYEMLSFYSVIIILNIIFAPAAEDYHYALALPAIFCTSKIIIDNYKSLKLEAAIFVLALFLLSVPFTYKGLNDADFPLVLLAYPRLYGAILIVILYFRLMSFKKLPNDLNFAPTNS